MHDGHPGCLYYVYFCASVYLFMCFSIVIPCISGFLWCDTSLVLLFSIQIISALPLMPILNVWLYWKERKMREFIF